MYMLVKEVIYDRKLQHKTTYIAMLDIKKAYDVLWQDGLFYKLYKVGLSGKLWRILRCMYQDFVCKVMINGTASKSIKALRGIHQGAP